MSQMTGSESNGIDDALLTIEDLEVEFRIPRGTQGSLRSRRQIPFVRMGGRIIRYQRSAILAWIAARSVAAGDPTEPKPRTWSPETLAKRKATREANRLKRTAGQQP